MSQFTSPTDSADKKSPFNDPIYEGLILNEAAYLTKEGVVVLTEDFGSVRPLIDQYVLDICSSTALAWKLQSEKNFPSLKQLHLARYSGLLRAFAQRLWIDHHDRAYKPSLCSTILYDAMEQLHFQEAHSAKPMASSGVPGWQNWELENSLIEQVRLLAQGRGFQRSDYEIKRNCLDNYMTGKRFLDAVFSVHSRVEVARIDLKYKPRRRNELTLAQVRKDFRRLWENWRHKKVCEHLVGYIWCLEYTDQLRFHYHVILLFRAKVNSAYFRAMKIGKYWEDVITEERGDFFVCSPSDYQRPYLGRVEDWQTDKRELMLRKGVGYSTKQDQLLQIDLEKVKTFGTSQPPRKTTNAGRPRLPVEQRQHRSRVRAKIRRNDALFDGAGLWRQT